MMAPPRKSVAFSDGVFRKKSKCIINGFVMATAPRVHLWIQPVLCDIHKQTVILTTSLNEIGQKNLHLDVDRTVLTLIIFHFPKQCPQLEAIQSHQYQLLL